MEISLADQVNVAVMICANRLLPLLVLDSVLWHQGLFALPGYRDAETRYFSINHYPTALRKTCF